MIKQYLLSAVALVFVCLSLTICAEPKPNLSDGPYVKTSTNQWHANWVCDGKAQSQTLERTRDKTHIAQCQLGANLYPDQKRPSLTLPANPKIAAISDIHGQYQVTVKLLQAQGIVDEDGQWQFGKGHLVITGDVFDRGPEQTQALWFIYDLQQQARKAGGDLHFLLGNHEVMVLNGDLRYLHPKYHKVAEILNTPYEQLYGENTVLGQWLRTRNVLVKIGDILFLHGGIHPDLAKQKLTLEQINQIFNKNLIEDPEKPRKGLGRYLLKTHGPIWYRGYFRKPTASVEDIDLLRSHFKVDKIVVGHTTQKHITAFYHGKVLAIDAGLKGGKSGQVLFLQDGDASVGNMDGTQASVPTTLQE